MNNLLSRNMCVLAVNEWEIARKQYSEIEKLINPSSAFTLNPNECKWMNENNHNTYFHIYTGVHNGKLIMIFVPLDKSGNEIDLPSYLISELSPLNNDLNLMEKRVINNTRISTLSKDLELKNQYDEINRPFENEPSISENWSVNGIMSWKNQTLDWFYHEITEFKGLRIFRTFRVPLADLARNNPNLREVICFFGFKVSTIYNRLIPFLIFVALDEVTLHSEIIQPTDSESSGNTFDFDSPCPPFCREESSFTVFKQ